MDIRQRVEQDEKNNLSKYAMLSINSKGRDFEIEPCEIRTCFGRDRDRIIHSKSFRRLKHKTQVFLSPEGDHYRTRLTHTLEVSQVARTIAKSLRLNEDLTEAIALGHDLGHTPFGHAGERALNDISPTGFRHYEQSVRVAQIIDKLNLTYEVIDGIVNHTKGQQPSTLEGQVVRISDVIAFLNHDIDDAIRAKVLTEENIPKDISAVLGNKCGKRIDTLVKSVINNSHDNIICMDKEVEQAFLSLKKFMYSEIYVHKYAKREEKKVPDLVEKLYTYYIKYPEKLDVSLHKILENEGKNRAVIDFIAGMTDGFAISVYESLFVPKRWQL